MAGPASVKGKSAGEKLCIRMILCIRIILEKEKGGKEKGPGTWKHGNMKIWSREYCNKGILKQRKTKKQGSVIPALCL